MLRSSFVVICSLLLTSCGEKDTYDPARDYFTFANTEQFVTRHIALDLDVDFDRQVLRGSVMLNMIVLDSSADQIILDTRDIDVENVVFFLANGDTEVASFEMGDVDTVLGTPLLISVPASMVTSDEIAVTVNYKTSPNASALQWLPPELTTGGDECG
jgi:aminopeptidase N